MHTIDLHVHSTYSDGTCTPADLVALASKAGLSCIALTDHDTVEGIPVILNAAKDSCVRIIPGVELSSANLTGKKQDIHILGLNVDCGNREFTTHLKQFQKDRLERNAKMCRMLACAGYDISLEALQSAYPHAVLTRCHIARYLTDHGYTSSIGDAFKTLIGSGCPYYVPRIRISPAKAVELIKNAGGCAVLAHPLLYELSEMELCRLIEQLKQAGLDAIEAIYSKYTMEEETYVRSLAKRFSLSISGGSDFHGDNKPEIKIGVGEGNLSIPEHLLDQLPV